MEGNEDSDGSEVEETEVLFKGLDTQASNSDSYVEGEILLKNDTVGDMRRISALST